jgi:hypothetical protein|nr:MAG TPA: hypothetical protein [Bacteriophage sp.]
MAIDEVLGGNIVTDKQFLNDTVGTVSFKPLNKIVEDVGNSLKQEGAVKVIKKVQRGYYNETSGNALSRNITITKVDPNKSFLVMYAGNATGGSSGRRMPARGYISSTGTSITIYPTYEAQGSELEWKRYYEQYYWEVVEFY